MQLGLLSETKHFRHALRLISPKSWLTSHRPQCRSHTGRAHWEAHYRFSVTKRVVHNIIEAEFTFMPEGLIATHKDTFDFWRWSRQALGLGGIVLGWIPFFRKADA